MQSTRRGASQVGNGATDRAPPERTISTVDVLTSTFDRDVEPRACPAIDPTGQLISAMSLSLLSLRRFVRRALVDATGETAPGREQLAAAFDTLCERLRRQLLPLFGTAAVSALSARSVHAAAADFPWLRELTPDEESPCVAEPRIASVAQLDVDALKDGLAAVLAHNIALLNTFVGEDLVLPLVQQAWGVIDAPRTEGEL